MPERNRFPAVLQPVRYRWQNDRDGLVEDGTAPACRASAGSSGFHEMNHPVVLARDNAAHAAVAFANRTRDGVKVPEVMADGIVPAITNPGDGGRSDAINVAVAFAQNQVGEIRTSNVSGTINTNSNASGRNTPMAAVAFTRCDNGGDASVEVTPTMRCGSNYSAHPAVAHALRGEGVDASEDGTGRGTPLVPVAPTLTAHNDPSRSPQSSEVTQQVAAVHAASMTVRRLTAKECERLQAFPDDYTLIPWRKKPATECPDGPRYKALGNSMACNCMAWIGERIAAVEARND